MTEKAKSKMYMFSYTDGRPDEIFELETDPDCHHQFIPLGVPTLPYGESTMTRGGCLLCSTIYVEEKDKKDQHVAFYRKVATNVE